MAKWVHQIQTNDQVASLIVQFLFRDDEGETDKYDHEVFSKNQKKKSFAIYDKLFRTVGTVFMCYLLKYIYNGMGQESGQWRGGIQKQPFQSISFQ